MAQTYSVYEITLQIKELLESGFGYVSIEGEISNFEADWVTGRMRKRPKKRA